MDSFIRKEEKKNEKPRHIRGVSCDVQGCCYHDGDSYCTADNVSIGPISACTCSDTVCATFKPKAR